MDLYILCHGSLYVSTYVSSHPYTLNTTCTSPPPHTHTHKDFKTIPKVFLCSFRFLFFFRFLHFLSLSA